MTVPTLLAQLAGLPVLAGVGDASLELLLEHGAVIEVETDSQLVTQGERGDSMFVLLDGALEIVVDGQSITTITECGSPIGEIQLLAGGRRSATVRIAAPSRLFEIPASVLPTLTKHAPTLLERLLALARQRLRASRFEQLLSAYAGPVRPGLIHELGTRADWQELRRGEHLVKRGQDCTGCYIIVSGRLAVLDGPGATPIELGAGETIGGLSIVTDEPHLADVVALRNTELTFIPRADFELLVEEAALLPIIIKNAVRRASHSRAVRADRAAEPSSFAVTPLDGSTAAPQLCAELFGLFERCASSLLLDVNSLCDHLDVPHEAIMQPDHPSWIRVRAWFDNIQTEVRFVVLQDSPEHPGWSHFCRDHTDVVIGVADGDRTPPAPPPPFSPFELCGEGNDGHDPRRFLVLTHAHSTRIPTGTRAWLERYREPEHIHLRWPDRAEVGRLARALTGRSIGVVLSGGNAHAMAQLGALQALREANIPVDLVGGTSFGAIVAGLWAARTSDAQLRVYKDQLVRFNPFRSLALSRLGLIKGAACDWIAQNTFAKTNIEDLWLGMYAVSVNFTTTKETVIDRGPVWAAVRASGSVPVIIEPFMHEGQVFVDGGLVNNLPIDIMQRRTHGPVIAIDVSPDKEIADDSLAPSAPSSGWLRRRFLDRNNGQRRFRLFDILMRSFTISSSQRVAAHKDQLELYITPEVSGLSSSDFDSYEDFLALGYVATIGKARQLRERLCSDYFLTQESDLR